MDKLSSATGASELIFAYTMPGISVADPNDFCPDPDPTFQIC
jgi:hypothetical protein